MSGGSGSPIAADRRLRVRLLGGFAVEGFDEHDLGTRKARLLLKRLAAALGQPVSGEDLADVVWGDGPPRNPADQVSVLVSRLRGVLGAERIPRTDAGYRLAADWFDLAELEDRVAEVAARLNAGEQAASLAAAHTVLILAAGPLLPEETDEWVEPIRTTAERLVARGRLLAAEAALLAGELDAARAAAQAVLDADAYDETALRLTMRADARAGRPAVALAAYADLRQRLAEDLGTDPATETEDLHLAIVRGEFPAGAASTTMNLVGRDRELEHLDRVLVEVTSGPGTSLVIEAEAGMGKSTLVWAWTMRIANSAIVIAGRCEELGSDLPLQPIADGLAAYLDVIGRGPANAALGDDADLVRPLIAGTAMRSAVTTFSNAETGRVALFRSISNVIARAADGRPVVLIVEDLHNAAAGTAEFLDLAVRRVPHLLAVATRRPDPGPDLATNNRITLGPFGLTDTIALVDADLAEALHDRSGGHPLFLAELAKVTGDELPQSILASVRGQLDGLGPAARSLEAAAVCGRDIDAALVAVLTGRSASEVLDHLEQAAARGLLAPRGAALAFRHELLREAVEEATSPPRRQELHRAAVTELARRPGIDPLTLARHARRSGDKTTAAAALVAAAERARERFENAVAEQLLDEAVELHDGVEARLARGRIRIGRLDLGAAREDADRAIELGAGVAGFELAGWVAYYSRNYDNALQYAEEGVARSTEDDVRASCLALAGRVRHTRGDLATASAHLATAVDIAPPGIRPVVQVWRAQLLGHLGDAPAAIDSARRALLDPHLAHPFAAGHGWFSLAYSLAVSGQWVAAMEAIGELDQLLARQNDKRLPPTAANIRGWLLRGAGQLDAAMELHRYATDATPGPTFLEAHYAAMLDLAECRLAAGAHDEAATVLDDASGIVDWIGSMSWRHRNRYRLLGARVAALAGSYDDAAGEARAVSAVAGERGDRRYHQRGLIVAATIDAAAGKRADAADLATLVESFSPLAGPDGWRDLGELAAATGRTEVWQEAEALAARLVKQTGGHDDAAAYGDAVRRQLDVLKP